MTSLYLGAVTGQVDRGVSLPLKRANRHGVITGATGTGKTVTLQVLAEGFLAAGVPVFLTDVKGDLGGLSAPSKMQDFLVARAQEIGLDPFVPSAFPVIFWDVFGKAGHPVHTTISEMGALLLGRLLELNDVQQGVLDIAFRMADEQGLLLLDLKDLRAVLQYMGEHADDVSKTYGLVAGASLAAIGRSMLRLEEQGGSHLFAEPALDVRDLMRVSYDGRGFASILQSSDLLMAPRLYAAFLLWLLSELFEDLPEAGDLDKPKLVLFFDEAHLLFKDLPKSVLERIEQVVRLIRSKGVGVYFVTQNPSDIPDIILGQLGNKVQHALRVFTPAQKRDVAAVVDGFRPNPDLDIEKIVQELRVGEALVSFLGESGDPAVTERVLVRPPSSSLGMVDPQVIAAFMLNSPVAQIYSRTVDRESAFEMLKQRHDQAASDTDSAAKPEQKPHKSARDTTSLQSVGGALLTSVVRAVGSSVGRQIAREVLRGVLGGMSGGSRRR